MLYIRKHIWQGIKTFTIWPAFHSDHRQSDRVMYTDYRNWNGKRNGNCFYHIFVFGLWIENNIYILIKPSRYRIRYIYIYINIYKMTVTLWKYEKQYFFVMTDLCFTLGEIWLVEFWPSWFKICDTFQSFCITGR